MVTEVVTYLINEARNTSHLVCLLMFLLIRPPHVTSVVHTLYSIVTVLTFDTTNIFFGLPTEPEAVDVGHSDP